MNLSTLTGTAGLVLGAAAGLFVGGLTTYVAWTWQADTVQDLTLETERWKSTAAINEQRMLTAQRNSQAAVDHLKIVVDDQKTLERSIDDVNQAIHGVASATRLALRTPAVKLLNDGAGGGRTETRQDPRKVLGLPTAPSPDPAGPAADDGSGASELEVTRWINYARCATSRRQTLTEYLQGVVKASPQCFEIVEDGGPDYWAETDKICGRR